MKIKNFLKTLYVVPCIIMCISCSEKWDEHYRDNQEQSGENIYDLLQKDADLTIFVKLVQIAKLEDLLASPETFTIWAPTNEALIEYADIFTKELTANDSTVISLIVNGHISRKLASTSKIPTSGSEFNVEMLNNKYVFFKHGDGGSNFTFGGNELDNSRMNISCFNGILHVIKGKVIYDMNLWEVLRYTSDFSDIYSYFNSYDSTYLDLRNSIKIGVNSEGKSVYDSVFIFSNKLLNRIGRLDKEDSTYTCIIPTNEAYTRTIELYKGFFKSNGGQNSNLNADSVTFSKAQSLIANCLIFRPDADFTADSLVSSGGIVFHHPSKMIEGATLMPASNGKIWKADSLNQDIYDILYKPIDIEIERLRFGMDLDYFALYATTKYYSYTLSVPGVSGGYLYIEDNNIQMKPYIEIQLLGAKSAKYDVYCTIVPANAEDATNEFDQTILDFDLVYFKNKNLITQTLNHGFVTDKTHLQEIKVATGLNIPFFDARAALAITINVPLSQTSMYARSVRIDKIRLVPVYE